MQELIANRHYLIFIDCNNIYIILQTVKAIDLYTEVTKKHTSFTAQTTVGKQKAQASSFENVIALAHHSLMKVWRSWYILCTIEVLRNTEKNLKLIEMTNDKWQDTKIILCLACNWESWKELRHNLTIKAGLFIRRSGVRCWIARIGSFSCANQITLSTISSSARASSMPSSS